MVSHTHGACLLCAVRAACCHSPVEDLWVLVEDLATEARSSAHVRVHDDRETSLRRLRPTARRRCWLHDVMSTHRANQPSVDAVTKISDLLVYSAWHRCPVFKNCTKQLNVQMRCTNNVIKLNPFVAVCSTMHVTHLRRCSDRCLRTNVV